MNRRRSRAPSGSRPAVAVAVGAATAVLALSAAAVAPTLTAAGDAAVTAELQRTSAEVAGFELSGHGRLDGWDVDRLAALLDAELGDGPGTGIRTVRVDPVVLEHAGAQTRIRPITATGLADTLELTSGVAAGEGLVLPEVLATELGLVVGDVVDLRRGDAVTARPVIGIARPLGAEQVPLALRPQVRAHEEADPRSRPIDLVVGSETTVLDVADELGATSALDLQHAAPVLGSLSAARQAGDDQRRLARRIGDERTDVGAEVAATLGSRVSTRVGLGPVVREADAAVSALAGPATAAGVAGQLVALAVVGAAAAFAARDRTRELRLAAIRGRSPLRQGLEGGARALPAMLAGAAMGTVAALATVATISPTGEVPAATALAAARSTVLALGPAILVVVAVTAGSVANLVRVGRRARWIRVGRWPWEPAVLVLAVVAYAQLRASGGVTGAEGASTGGLHPLALAFPILALLGTVGLAVRVGRRVLPALRHLGGEAPADRFLAIRRLAAASGPALLLAGATALALGLVVHTSAVADSLEVAVAAKATLQLGAEAVTSEPGVEAGAAEADAVRRGRGRLVPGDVSVDVLLIDPATFGSGADVTRSGGRGQRELVHRLDHGGERLPVLLAGGGVAEGVAVLEVPGFRVPLEVTAEVDAFPGLGTDRPLVVASLGRAAALVPAPPGDHDVVGGRWWPEVWASGPDAAARLVAAGADPALVRTAEAASTRPQLVAVTWGLGALQALAMLATVLALAGVLLFVASRQGATQVSYAMARRMGLSAGMHRRALMVEVVVLLAIALVVAVVLGLVTSAVVAGFLDPVPELPPAPRPTVPIDALVAVAVALLSAGVTGAALLQRGADRLDVAEVLRGG